MLPPPTYVPPLVTVRLLKPANVLPMVSTPALVHVEPGPVTMTMLFSALEALPIEPVPLTTSAPLETTNWLP